MKMYNYYIAVGALKKYGYTNFVTYNGEQRTLRELLSKPIVPEAKSERYIPRADGTVATKDGFILIHPIQ